MTIQEVKKKTVPIFKKHGITYAAVFGSVARGENRAKSDVDILIRIGKPMGMVGYMVLIEALEKTLKKKVDLVTEQSLNKRIRPFVLPDLKIIYEK